MQIELKGVTSRNAEAVNPGLLVSGKVDRVSINAGEEDVFKKGGLVHLESIKSISIVVDLVEEIVNIEWAEALVVPRVVMVMFVLNGLFVSIRFVVLVLVVRVVVCVAVAPVAVVVAEVSSMSIRVSTVDNMIELLGRAHVVRVGVSMASEAAIAAVATISAGTVVECGR